MAQMWLGRRMKDKVYAICLDCSDEVEYRTHYRDAHVEYRGVTVQYSEEFACCAICGTEIYVEGLWDRNLARIREAYSGRAKT